MNRPARPQRGVPVLTLAIVALVPALALGAIWGYADANVPPPTTTTTTTLPPPPVDELATDLLSFRRHPTPMAERAAAEASVAAFDERFGTFDVDIGETDCLVIADAGATVAAYGTSDGLLPASNEKLFVAAVALDVLGPDHRFRTELRSPRPFGEVVPGNVYLVGGGDPVLRTDDVVDPLRYPAFNTTSLDELADQLVALGVTTIQGDVIGDGSRYDDEFRVPSWGDDVINVDAGPYDALLVNDGLIGNGNYGLDPNRSAAVAFVGLLNDRGITVEGSAGNGPTPADADLTTLAFIDSEPLTEVLVELLHTSDNNTAEMLVKEIGVAVSGEGSRRAGLAAVRERLAAWGVPLTGVVLEDGSGLSRENRATCAALVSVVSASPVAEALVDLLPVAGRDGTLESQLLGTAAEGRLRAKTGTLTDVKALTGSQPGSDRRPVEFSLILNGEGVDDPAVYEPVWAELVDLVSDYPLVVDPDVDLFAPLPASARATDDVG